MSHTVSCGRLAVTRLYDLAYEVDVDRVERELRESSSRPRFTRARPKAVFYGRPPVDLALGRTMLRLASGAVEAEVSARIFDFGAARLSYEVPVASMSWDAYVALANALEEPLESPAPWEADISRVRDLVRGAMSRPTEHDLEVDYLYATVQRLDPPLRGAEILEKLDLVPLLTGDTQPLSPSARQDVLRWALSYYEDDLVVLGWSRALIVEPGGEADIADIIGTAHAQVLELRYYDERLDAELPLMYDRVEEARDAFRGLARRRYAALARSLHALLAEVTEVSERIDKALVVTEDVYLATVYQAALEQHRARGWGVAVDRKLAIIRDTYTALYDEATSARAEYLELAIVLLIVIEILLAFVIG
ncbi:MAG TPA: hypothetical protein VFQ22_02265 [Longimicrobiales bacterium]|nr:hypothetical protein [Longimicrobiales bacterium]